jgi:hypothetical protein
MSELSEYLKEKEQEQIKQAIHWNEVREEWIQTVSNFLVSVKSWLAEEIQEGLIQIEECIEAINEEHLGSYSVSSLKLHAIGKVLHLRPIGRLIIGAQGRIDLESKSSGERVILLHLSAEEGWVYLPNNERGNYPKLSQPVFKELIKGLLS